jgi:SanA protein
VVVIGAENAYLIVITRDAIVADVASAPPRDQVIVLGSYVSPAGRPARELTHRLEVALALYRAGRVRRIIVSGMVRPKYEEPHAMAAWLQERGIPASDIIVDARGRRTAASMANAAQAGVRATLVATQGYHLPRALYLARRAGIDALGVPAVTDLGLSLAAMRIYLREMVARAEILVEVALLGVRS